MLDYIFNPDIHHTEKEFESMERKPEFEYLSYPYHYDKYNIFPEDKRNYVCKVIPKEGDGYQDPYKRKQR